MQAMPRRGLTRVEVLVAVVCVPTIVVIVLSAVSALFPYHRRFNAKLAKDSTQAHQIYKSALIYADENGGEFPRPGSLNRKPIDGLGDVPMRGELDIDLNTTANMYSMLIALNYFGADLLISPLERNPNVQEDVDYNYDAYDPVNDSYWDPTFVADLNAESNTSFAHQPLVGRQSHLAWSNQTQFLTAVVGSRGPKDGVGYPESHTCNVDGVWMGNVVFSDGHVEYLDTMKPEVINFDNLFAIDDSHELDAFLTFTRLINNGVAEWQFD